MSSSVYSNQTKIYHHIELLLLWRWDFSCLALLAAETLLLQCLHWRVPPSGSNFLGYLVCQYAFCLGVIFSKSVHGGVSYFLWSRLALSLDCTFPPDLIARVPSFLFSSCILAFLGFVLIWLSLSIYTLLGTKTVARLFSWNFGRFWALHCFGLGFYSTLPCRTNSSLLFRTISSLLFRTISSWPISCTSFLAESSSMSP